jgi:hypothetical protein
VPGRFSSLIEPSHRRAAARRTTVTTLCSVSALQRAVGTETLIAATVAPVASAMGAATIVSNPTNNATETGTSDDQLWQLVKAGR